MKEPIFTNLIGKRVIVIWTDRANSDWIAFRLMDEFDGVVKLKGVASPDGIKHNGSFDAARYDEIRNMIEWKENA